MPTEDYLKERLNNYIVQNGIEIAPEDCEKAIKYLIKGDIKKLGGLGGLTAIRGFVYQYYVALFYMVEMLHSENTAWWTNVIFEYFDDITLHGDNRVRFVQIKTVRESGNHRITDKELVKRDNDLNSWMDKLFINMTKYKNNDILADHNLLDYTNFQFEIATNSPENKTPLIFLENTDYNLSDNKIIESETIYSSMKKEVLIRDKKSKKTTVVKKLETDFDINIKWCLCRFHLNRLGSFDQLKIQIEKKISDIVKANGESLKSWVAQYIFQSLLSKVIDRTHQDHNLIDKRELVFSKKELLEWFAIWEQQALDIHFNDAMNNNIRFKFDRCFTSLKKQFERDWRTPLKTELIEALNWLQNKLLEQNKVDSFLYNRFLNRLFELSNTSQHFSLDDIDDENYLKESIRHITFCLVFYPYRDAPYEKSKLLYKQGQLKGNEKKIFAIFNARNQEEYKYAQDRIAVAISECSDSKNILDEYYCIVTHNIKPQTINSFSSLPGSLLEIPSNERSIISKPDNLIFVEQTIIDNTIQSSKTLLESFKTQAVQDIWHADLATRE